MAVVMATLGTGSEFVSLSPHLGDAGLAKDIADLGPDAILAESETGRAKPCRSRP